MSNAACKASACLNSAVSMLETVSKQTESGLVSDEKDLKEIIAITENCMNFLMKSNFYNLKGPEK